MPTKPERSTWRAQYLIACSTLPYCVQYLTVRNKRGREMLDLVSHRLERSAAVSSGSRAPFVTQTVISDDE